MLSEKYYLLKEVFVNTDTIAEIETDEKMNKNYQNGLFVPDTNSQELGIRKDFSRILFTGGNFITVVGKAATLASEIFPKNLLTEEKRPI
jgi:hypothetical protein